RHRLMVDADPAGRVAVLQLRVGRVVKRVAERAMPVRRPVLTRLAVRVALSVEPVGVLEPWERAAVPAPLPQAARVRPPARRGPPGWWVLMTAPRCSATRPFERSPRRPHHRPPTCVVSASYTVEAIPPPRPSRPVHRSWAARIPARPPPTMAMRGAVREPPVA